MARVWTGGHTAPVLCVGAAAGDEGVLASGAEGGEVTVWGQDGTALSRLRLSSREDVTCAVFSPLPPGYLYVSHGETVSVLDPRSLKEPMQELKDVGEEEINSLSVSGTGASLALADDSGAVRVVDLQSGKVNRTLRKHSNICSSVAFRPQRPQSLVSAGLDMQLLLWNLQKARPVWTFSLQEALEDQDQPKAGQLFNPPLAHCVSAASCGNVLACAAEDGRVYLARVGVGSRLERHSALRAHAQGASQVHFLNFLPHPYWMVTGGNDGVVALWDVSGAPAVSGEGTGQPRRRRAKKKGKKPEPESGQEVPQEDGVEQNRAEEPKLRLSHEQKVTWACPALLKRQPCVLVADQSPSLAVYPLTGF